MKHCYYFLIVSLILTTISSCQSKEEKAQKLINDQMFSTLYDYKSYEPVEIKIDSAFTSIYRDSIIRNWGVTCVALRELLNDCQSEYEEASSIMEIYRDSYYSSYGIKKYNDARTKFNEEIAKAKIYLEQWQNANDSIVSLSAKFRSEYCGWQATHKFRCKTKGGNSMLAIYIYVFDPKMKEILYSYDAEDETDASVIQMIDAAITESRK